MRFETEEGPLEVHPSALIVAGWTARDADAVAHHIAELAEIGVPPPSETPLFYRAAASLLTRAERIEVVGRDTSGEAEPLLLRAEERLWLGLGSDHTDRTLERVSVAKSKQACAKPLASVLWPFESVVDRLDALELSAEIDEGRGWTLYQRGTLAAIRPLPDLLRAAPLAEDAAMLCGTLPALGGVRPAARFRMALHDRAAGRRIEAAYEVASLPEVS
jgi:hypothetical protein